MIKKEEISLKNTKAEILDALNAALEREKNMTKSKSNPEQEEKERTIQEAVVESKKNVEAQIFSQELIEKYNKLETAIQALEEKLKNLYGIDKELSHLTVVMNAGKDCLAQLEEQKKEKSEELEAKIKELEEEYKKKNSDLTSEYELKAKSLKLERDRELEEYNYKIKRERELANNAWEDEKKTREAKLKVMEEETKKLLADVQEKEKYINDLEEKVKNIPNLMNEEYEKGKSDATTELEKEHQYKLELLKKDYQNTIDRQIDKIESLNEELNKSIEMNKNLQEKMDKAYVEMKELASKTVEVSGSVKIIGNNSNEISKN